MYNWTVGFRLVLGLRDFGFSGLGVQRFWCFGFRGLGVLVFRIWDLG